MKVNCAALPADLLESELFGHERGAFTGAGATRVGKFEFAQHGTILLDEIGELPAALQAKLLHVLQDRELTRLGSNRPVEVDVRVLAATNRDLEAMMRAGTFREDLYYRLQVIELRVPPLRERREEIPALVEFFLVKYAKVYRRPAARPSSVLMEALTDYSWPGNIRELENMMKRFVVLQEEALILGELVRLRQAAAATSAAAQQALAAATVAVPTPAAGLPPPPPVPPPVATAPVAVAPPPWSRRRAGCHGAGKRGRGDRGRQRRRRPGRAGSRGQHRQLGRGCGPAGACQDRGPARGTRSHRSRPGAIPLEPTQGRPVPERQLQDPAQQDQGVRDQRNGLRIEHGGVQSTTGSKHDRFKARRVQSTTGSKRTTGSGATHDCAGAFVVFRRSFLTYSHLTERLCFEPL